MKLEYLIVYYEGVARIMATLKTGDDISTLRKPVDNFALALVTPLRANHNNICHKYTLSIQLKRLRYNGDMIRWKLKNSNTLGMT
jgi:hypothetical protein